MVPSRGSTTHLTPGRARPGRAFLAEHPVVGAARGQQPATRPPRPPGPPPTPCRSTTTWCRPSAAGRRRPRRRTAAAAARRTPARPRPARSAADPGRPSSGGAPKTSATVGAGEQGSCPGKPTGTSCSVPWRRAGRPALRHRDPTDARDAPGHGRGGGGRRSVRRGSDGQPAAGDLRRADRDRSGPVRPVRHHGQPDRPAGARPSRRRRRRGRPPASGAVRSRRRSPQCGRDLADLARRERAASTPPRWRA